MSVGDFGLPGGVACPGSRIDRNRVRIEPVDHGGAGKLHLELVAAEPGTDSP